MRVILSAWSPMVVLFCLLGTSGASAQTMEDQLRLEGADSLARAARQDGDPRRGAIVFYQTYLSCRQCHRVGEDSTLGPDLATHQTGIDDAYLVESVLEPSRKIREGYETINLLLRDGTVTTGILLQRDAETVRIREVSNVETTREIQVDDIDDLVENQTSIMPSGQVNQLTNRQQFLDLVRYLMAISEGGPAVAAELEPAAALYAAKPLPDYESNIDHAGIIKSLDRKAYLRGEAIYNRLCVNCHGTRSEPGSLPTSLKFATGKFKNGNDPHSMYQTLTRGFGMMVPQSWMVPTQKYDVIHYIRQSYLKSENRSQYFEVDEAYLQTLPKGTTRGPAPSTVHPWEQMDYGPNLVMTLEVGDDGRNFAYKGNAIRLDRGPGGISRGNHWMVFDYDTLRVAAGWSGKQFCDWNGINFNDRHAVHPRIVGELHFQNLTGPGWGRPSDGSFDDVRLVGRDGRRYGPLPRDWAHYEGMYYHGAETIISYRVGDTDILEMPGIIMSGDVPIFTRTLNLGPRTTDLVMQVVHHDEDTPQVERQGDMLLIGAPSEESLDSDRQIGMPGSRFENSKYVEVANPERVDWHSGDFTLAARIRTSQDGTIVARAANQDEWTPDGMTWFIRGGHLVFDIGWVGAVNGTTRVVDGKWHDIAMTYQAETGKIQFHVDGRIDGNQGRLKPKAPLDDPTIRIGFTASNFPRHSFFEGDIERVRYWNRILEPFEIAGADPESSGLTETIAATETSDEVDASRASDWDLNDVQDQQVLNRLDRHNIGNIVFGKVVSGSSKSPWWTAAGLAGDSTGAQWLTVDRDLRLRIPAGGAPRQLVVWTTSFDDVATLKSVQESFNAQVLDLDLKKKTGGGPSRWPQELLTEATIGQDSGPLATDVLQRPTTNPWFCRLRLTGFDFSPDGDAAYVSTWDGSIWKVKGLNQLPDSNPAKAEGKSTIAWRRIASGLFQPLGVKLVDGKVYVTCRDQICLLHDLNGDEEIDYFENFNNDHQVTDHFHEFAMGLQTDDRGNFYYAKSARHALTALVPHHGTLLRVSPDGARTEIVANGFRAANGVCINPDGTFIVTDQEGHWNPKNRINYVKEDGFYGNMFGYHDVTDASDSAMEQPLCWITNSFDRSPAELLWVDSPRWGPLNHRLLNLSYGYGKVYVVPHETVEGQVQGGMCELPIDPFPTGVMRGRFHPNDGQLYTCGMFAWAGSQTQPGGFYRIRYTGRPIHLPIDLAARRGEIKIEFSGELAPSAASDPGNYAVKVWSLERTENYGSKHFDEHSLPVTGAMLSKDGRTVTLAIPDIAPTWCMEIKYELTDAGGHPFTGTIHNTIHHLSDDPRE